MKLHTASLAAGVALALSAGLGMPAMAAVPQPPATSSVIVLLRDQHPQVQSGGQRMRVTRADQRQLVAQARAAGATRITQFSVINAFAATMTPAERQHLASSPQVAAVVPDLAIRLATLPTETVGEAGKATKGAAPKAAPSACPKDPKQPLTEPEALQTTHDTEARQVVTGKGVTVAFLADDIDTRNPDFVRPDGSHVFTDAQDFSGEGLGVPGDDREAFGDASAIAAQGRQTYDLSTFVNPADPLPHNCDIRVLGMAPGASLVALKVVASNGFGSTSGVVQAIDYAVNVDHVNVINESLGSNPYPDNGTDPFTLANDAAVAAGVTIVNSSGDAGYANTVDSPGTDPNIITTGASTTYRIMTQTWDTLPGFSGTWDSDNVSAISSGGIKQDGRVVDLIAPGDLGWALCTPTVTVYLGCTNYQGKPSPIQAFGGTSQAAPLTAGAAALVIQAYATKHNGVKPAPALIKRILTSTATDNGDPSDRQGAGLLNALAAVRVAQSISDSNGAPAAQGNGVLFGSTQLDATGKPDSARTFVLPVTNVGATPRTLAAHVRGLASVLSDQQGSIELDATAPSNMVTRGGAAANYVTKKFTVPPGADHLDASIAWADPNGAATTLVLLDPKGAFAGYSLPQTVIGPDFGHVDVHSPVAGTWTALMYTPHSFPGFDGQIDYEFTTTRYAGFGAVSGPLNLAPGQTGTFRVTADTPAQPGDLAAVVRVDTDDHQRLAVPLVLRSLVPDDGNGAFSGVLTGGNGRSGAPAQTSTFRFDVPLGKRDVDVNVDLHGTVNQGVVGYLVSPDGQIVSQATNVLAANANGNPTEYGRSLQNYKRDPAPGRWTYVVVFENPVSGAGTREQFSGRVMFDHVDVTASGVPSGAVLPRGKPVTAKITVHNTSSVSGSYYVDARMSKWVDVQLIPNATAAGVPLAPSASLGFLVPPETSRLTGITSGTVPVSADLAANTGEPEQLGPPGPGNIAVVSDESGQLSQGLWLLEADRIGPVTHPNPATVNFAAIAHTQRFDDAVTSSTGDHWLAAVDAQPPAFAPLNIDPGNAGTITVTFDPDAPKGTKVTGWLYVDDMTLSNNAGDELAYVYYDYTVG